MTDGPNRVVILEIGASDRPLLELLSGTDVRAEIDIPASKESERLPRGSDRRMHTTVTTAMLVTIAAATPAAIHALASIVREYLRAKRTKVRIRRADGSSLEIDGSHSLAELERLIDAESTDGLPK